jgi:glutamine amidotransferase
MIRIVDYGIGNIQAFLNLFDRLGLEAKRAKDIDDLEDASHLILPGVGHFDYAMQSFNNSGLRVRLEELVLKQKVPILGICVGMQMMADSSEEGILDGLGWLPGSVKSLKSCIMNDSLPLPHMGWNELQVNINHELFPSVDSEPPEFYFLHSFYFSAKLPSDVIATTNYGINFDSVVCNGNIFGMQCHPEKSHTWGQRFLRAFAEL